MSIVKIQETANEGAQLSQGRYFLIANKFKIKRGSNIGKAIYVIRMSQLDSDRNNPNVGVFTEVKSFLLSPKEFDAWITLLIQLNNKKLTDLKDGEKDASQVRL